MNSRTDKFLNILSERSNTGIHIKYKDESLLMKIIGYLLFFNKSFMTEYITTIDNTIYIPKELETKMSQDYLLTVLAHEYVHILDSKKDKLYKIKYLFPQILAPFMLLFGFINWWLALILFILFIAPLPAPWRKKYELRGYKMSLFSLDCINKELSMSENSRALFLESMKRFFNKQFNGPGYYFMWVFGVIEELEKTIDEIMSEDILKEDYMYTTVKESLNNSKI